MAALPGLSQRPLGGLLLLLLDALRAAAAATAGNESHSGLRGPLLHLVQEFAAPPGPAGNTVTISFFYGPACGNCLNFMRQGIVPLMEAGLPGDRVKLSILPFVRIEDKIPVDLSLWNTYCRASDVCFYALAPICALKVSVPAAAPVDSPALAKAMRFAECNQARRLASHPNSNLDVTPEMQSTEDTESRECAAQAGVPYDGAGGIKACADGPESLSLIHTPGYSDRIRQAEHTLEKSGEQQMPYIFLDDDVLRCDGSATGVECSGIWTEAGGDRLLKQRGSLLHVVCTRLNPQPPACAGVSAAPVKVGPTPKCENCAEAGIFHWEPTSAPKRRSAGPLGPAALVGVTSCLLGWFAWRRARKEVQLTEDSRDAQLME